MSKLIPISSLNLLTILIIDASWLSFPAKILRLSMNKRCNIISSWWLILYPMLLVFNSQESGSNDRLNSNSDGLSPWRCQYWWKMWLLLIWPSRCLRNNNVYHLFIVFWETLLWWDRSCNPLGFQKSNHEGQSQTPFCSLSTLLIYSIVLVWCYPSSFYW